MRAAQLSTANRGRNTRFLTYLTPVSTDPFSQPLAGAQNSARNGYPPPERRERLGQHPVPARQHVLDRQRGVIEDDALHHWIPATWSQLSRHCRATAAKLATFSQSITIASNSAVNRDCASAHGTRTCCTPCSAHRTRGTSARTSVRYCIVSRWRHSRGRRS